ncbi:hypothetical protein [Chryseobacterium sp. SIMBA_028]|uniref:hypothetical protein n=1 Tax=Chryseobacterium sp. SIMBA_028 TaxID=3085771 RepID=UPI003979F162
MIQFLLILLGITFPNNSTTTTHPTQITIQNNLISGEGMDTGGDTIPVLPPKK